MSNEFLQPAEEKIREGLKNLKGDQYEEVMKGQVAESLLELCRKEPEFAQAVAQGGSFQDCMAAVRKQVKGGALSDIDAYCAAAAFFFPGCKVRMKLEINLCGDADPEAFQPDGAGLVISLADFL